MKTRMAGVDELLSSAPTRRLMVTRALLVCGVAASLTWLATDIFAGLRYEGYRYPLDPISGLSAIGAPTRPLAVSFFGIYLVLKIAFALGVWISAGEKRALRITAGLLFAFAATDLAALFFPWHPAEAVGTFGNVMHSVLAGGLAVFLILLTIGSGANADGKWFRFCSYSTLLVMVVMGAIPLLVTPRLTPDVIPEWFGAGERINAYGFMLWMMVLAIVLLRVSAETLGLQQRRELAAPEESAKRRL